MKSVHYAATVTKVYREAVDSYLADPEHYEVKPEWIEELEKISHRPYTEVSPWKNRMKRLRTTASPAIRRLMTSSVL